VSAPPHFGALALAPRRSFSSATADFSGPTAIRPQDDAWAMAVYLGPMRRTLLAFAPLVLVTVVGCGGSARVTVPSAADQTSYAVRYPSELDHLAKDLQQNEQDARAVMASWDAVPAELASVKDVDVRGLFVKADRAGRSSGYAAERKNDTIVRSFHREEQPEIAKKVFGYVDFAAKGKCHDAEGVPGAAVAGVKEGVDKSLERRLRDANEATAFLEDEKGTLDKPTQEKLAKRLDDAAYASYLVNVAIGETKTALAERHAEASRVRTTLDDAVKEHKAKSEDASRPEAARKASAKRADELAAARKSIDGLAEQAKVGLDQADTRIAQLKKDYDANLVDLTGKLPTGKAKR